MVKISAFLTFILCIHISINAQLPYGYDIQVTSEIDTKELVPGRPLVGTITVTYDPKHKLDISTFRLEGKQLHVEFLKNVKISPTSPLVIDFFRFEIPAKPPGEYLLPPVSVKVGGKWYESVSSGYEIENEEAQTQSPILNQAKLRLETMIVGSQTLYPGQKIRLGYRYLYQGNVELTKEQLPLLDPSGFRKVGEKKILEGQKGATNIFEVTQELEALTPGSYTIGPSIVEGYPYVANFTGKKTYSKKLLRSEAPPITLEILPFPSNNKPSSFTGAVGNFSLTVSLIASPKVIIGESFLLEAIVSGEGDLSRVQFPNLKRQPGFEGLFRFSDLPPVGKIEGNKKTFQIDLRPLSPKISSIPSIEFSFFEPTSSAYKIVRSSPIPIEVIEAKAMTPIKIPQNTSSIDPIESIITTEVTQKIPFYQSWYSLLFVPFSSVLFLLQVQLKRYLTEKKVNEQQKSDRLFHFALSQKDSDYFYFDLTRSFLFKLEEIGEIENWNISPTMLSDQNLSGKIRPFLIEIDSWRYGRKKPPPKKQIVKQAKTLFKELS